MLRKLGLACALFALFNIPMTPALANHGGLCYSWTTVTHGTSGVDNHTLAMDECYDAKDGLDTVNGPNFGDSFALLGPGDDTFNGSDNYSAVNGENGVDTLYGYGDYDILYGGAGADVVYGGVNGDDLFGAGFCKETGHWGFYQSGTNEEAAPNGCVYEGGSFDGADHIYGGGGDDYIWESNSDNGSDDQADYIDGGPGSDHCMVGTEDTVVNCEFISTLT